MRSVSQTREREREREKRGSCPGLMTTLLPQERRKDTEDRMMSTQNKPTVLVTGFGPFRHYRVNASWEAVKLLEMDDVNLVKREVPVSYEEVDRVIPKLWEEYNPTLTVHCGVSCQASCLVLESQAFGSEYLSPDVTGCSPSNGCAPPPPPAAPSPCPEVGGAEAGGCHPLSTGLDVARICDQINSYHAEGLVKLPVAVSRDAGRYLCEYTFFTSLRQNQERTLFIHCPELEVYPAQDTAEAIKAVIKTALRELKVQF
jgi:pyroglutamyl-peptidase